jgi:hypothetical protein
MLTVRMVIIIIIIINCNWVFTRWQWLIYMYTIYKIATKFRRATCEAYSGNLETWQSSQHLLLDTRKPRKTCAELAGRRTFRILTSSKQSGI